MQRHGHKIVSLVGSSSFCSLRVPMKRTTRKPWTAAADVQPSAQTWIAEVPNPSRSAPQSTYRSAGPPRFTNTSGPRSSAMTGLIR
jgi:hypothetical protein